MSRHAQFRRAMANWLRRHELLAPRPRLADLPIREAAHVANSQAFARRGAFAGARVSVLTGARSALR